MNKRYEPLSDNEVEYVRKWTRRFDVGEVFVFKGWKKFYSDDEGAPNAAKIGGQVVEALEENPDDRRLDFIGLSKGPGKDGKCGDKSSKNHQYYVRLK